MEIAPVRRALISVSDKTGIPEIALHLNRLDIEILSTGGTARLLREHNIPVTEISDYTGTPEMMGGRVKTLHPKIYGGILGRRGVDEALMQASAIPMIDLVLANLYPFEQTAETLGITLAEAIESIDIGGPSMIRAAAKNHEAVTVITHREEYEPVIKELEVLGGVSLATRTRLAIAAFNHTASYDAAIWKYLVGENDSDVFPNILNLQFEKRATLRYGENPHQRAAFYQD